MSVHNVEFEDFLVERCVREALGKGWDEDVTEEELSSMRKLTLSWEKDITFGFDFVRFNKACSGYVNLADLKYLTGLEELQLDFYPKSTVLENMDVIVNCGKLRSLSMPLLLRGYNYANGYTGKGYRYLKDILLSCLLWSGLTLAWLFRDSFRSFCSRMSRKGKLFLPKMKRTFLIGCRYGGMTFSKSLLMKWP